MDYGEEEERALCSLIFPWAWSDLDQWIIRFQHRGEIHSNYCTVCQASQFDKSKSTDKIMLAILFKYKDVFRDFVGSKIENVMTDKLTPVGEVGRFFNCLSVRPSSPQHLSCPIWTAYKWPFWILIIKGKVLINQISWDWWAGRDQTPKSRRDWFEREPLRSAPSHESHNPESQMHNFLTSMFGLSLTLSLRCRGLPGRGILEKKSP